jgi:hypothetical protein
MQLDGEDIPLPAGNGGISTSKEGTIEVIRPSLP